MAPRLELQAILVSLLEGPNVYFQPPSNVQMIYPCIVYKRDFEEVQYADNSPYHRKLRYEVTYIDRNVDSEVPDKIRELPLCAFNRHFVADNLNHDVFNLFF